MNLRTTLGLLLLLPAIAHAQTGLTNGFFETVSGSAGSPQTYFLAIPDGLSSIAFMTAGGSGDVNIAVDFGNSGTVECSSSTAGTNAERCEILSPPDGSWYVTLSGTYSNVGLVGIAATRLQDGDPVTIADAADSQNWYYIDVPADQGQLEVEMRGGTGDPDLVVGGNLFDEPDCTSNVDGSNDDCLINDPAAGRWYVLVDGFSDYSNVMLEANYRESIDRGGALTPATLALLLSILVMRRWRRA